MLPVTCGIDRSCVSAGSIAVDTYTCRCDAGYARHNCDVPACDKGSGERTAYVGGEKFGVAVTGGTGTWTGEYTMLRIHRDIVSLRAPGRMMRSDALALDEATIAGIHRSTAFDSR